MKPEYYLQGTKPNIPAPRDSGNDFFIPQFSDGSVTFPGTRKQNKNISFCCLGYPKINWEFYCLKFITAHPRAL